MNKRNICGHEKEEEVINNTDAVLSMYIFSFVKNTEPSVE